MSGIFISSGEEVLANTIDVGNPIEKTPEEKRELLNKFSLNWKTNLETKNLIHKIQSHQKELLSLISGAACQLDEKLTLPAAIRYSELTRVLNLILKDKYEL